VSAAVAHAATPFSTRTYDLKDFTILEVSSVVKVIYTQGEPYSVQLTGRTDWLDLMEVKTSGGKLSVKAKKSKQFDNAKKKDQPDGKHNFILHLTAPCLQDIHLSGVCAFEARRLSPDHLSLCLGGVSKLMVDEIETPSLHMEISGVSELKTKNVLCQQLEVSVSGSSKMNAEKMAATQANISVSGASKANLPQLSKTEKATVTVNGASKITLDAEVSGQLQVELAGASEGELTYKGGNLRTACTAASKLKANVHCAAINATCDGASMTTFTGTADKVEIDRSGVAVNIDTSRLNPS
jgi:hypothetical protein